MPNRLRMVSAMFLSKHLRDADFASNNGGWQKMSTPSSAPRRASWPPPTVSAALPK